MNFNYAHNVDSDEPIMLINKHIGFDDTDGMGIDGSLFQQELLMLDQMGKKRIQVWINSVGGLVIDGYNIANAILKSSTPVDTYCVGMAASIAGVIFQCGRKRVMSDYGILMYHNPYAGDKTKSPLLDTMKASLNKVICDRSGMNSDAVRQMMDRTSYITATEAVNMGLCDEIEATVKLNTKYLPKSSKDGKKYWSEANKVLNKIFEPQNTKSMLKVTNKLKLNSEANEDAILEAIEAVENRANTAEEALTAANSAHQTALSAIQAELDAAKAKVTELEGQYNTAKQKLDTVEAEAAAAANAAAEAKATSMVHDAVRAGKIKNEAKVIGEWVAKGKADFEGTKGLIDSIPVNKQSVKFVIDKEKKDDLPKDPVALAMANLSNKLDQR